MWEAPTLRRCGVKREAGSSHGQLEQAKPTHTKKPPSPIQLSGDRKNPKGDQGIKYSVVRDSGAGGRKS